MDQQPLHLCSHVPILAGKWHIFISAPDSHSDPKTHLFHAKAGGWKQFLVDAACILGVNPLRDSKPPTISN